MKFIEDKINFLVRIVIILSCISLSFIVLLITLNVIGRAIGMPVPGSYDFVTLGSAVSGSLAIAYTTRRDGHVNVDAFVRLMSPKIQKIQYVISESIFFLIFSILTWQSYVMMLRRFSSEFTDTFDIPIFPFRLIWFLSMLLTTLLALFNIVKALKGADAE